METKEMRNYVSKTVILRFLSAKNKFVNYQNQGHAMTNVSVLICCMHTSIFSLVFFWDFKDKGILTDL